MLEKMAAFFEKRLDGYDEHMMTAIESAELFYPFTASLLPRENEARVLDLGCGTGLELAEYFKLCPSASVTGIDLSRGMLDALLAKFPDRKIEILCGSYFDLPFGEACYDAAVSVESLHHFTREEKIPLYRKLHSALKSGGYFILTDYFALDEESEQMHREALAAIKAAEGITDGELYHYDTPLTVKHEIETLHESGFSAVVELGCWGNTHTLKALSAPTSASRCVR